MTKDEALEAVVKLANQYLQGKITAEEFANNATVELDNAKLLEV